MIEAAYNVLFWGAVIGGGVRFVRGYRTGRARAKQGKGQGR